MNNSFSVMFVSGVDITAKFAGFKWGYNRKKGAALRPLPFIGLSKSNLIYHTATSDCTEVVFVEDTVASTFGFSV